MYKTYKECTLSNKQLKRINQLKKESLDVEQEVCVQDVYKRQQKICDYYKETGKLPRTSGCSPDDFMLVFDAIHTTHPNAQDVYKRQVHRYGKIRNPDPAVLLITAVSGHSVKTIIIKKGRHHRFHCDIFLFL